jgi:hypothetical protein
MWKKFSTVVSILSIAVYVFAAALAVYKIVNAVAEYRTISEREFAELQDMIRNAGVLGFAGADLESETRASVLRSLALEAVIVDVSGSAAFAVEKPGGQVLVSNYNNSAYSFNTKWKFYRPPYSARIAVDNRTTINLDALVGHIDRSRLTDILRKTLFIILLSVIVDFLVLMLDVIVFCKPDDASAVPKKPRKKVPERGEPELEEHEEREEYEEREGRKLEEASKQPVYDENADEPPEMYTGLIQRLHEELADPREKTADFVLLCVEWTGNGLAETPVARQIAEESAGFFKVKRISAFKKGENGIFILLPGATFKSGLKAVREFHGRILNNSVFKTAAADFYIGLTSRAGRQADPERLILEAEKALEKAKEDAAQPIVAFKANPSKFKDYLKNKNRQEHD